MMAEHHADPPLRDLGDVRDKLQDVFRKTKPTASPAGRRIPFRRRLKKPAHGRRPLLRRFATPGSRVDDQRVPAAQ